MGVCVPDRPCASAFVHVCVWIAYLVFRDYDHKWSCVIQVKATISGIQNDANAKQRLGADSCPTSKTLVLISSVNTLATSAAAASPAVC